MKLDILIDELNMPVMRLANDKDGSTYLEWDLTKTTKRNLKPEHLCEHINEYFHTLDKTDANRFYRTAMKTTQLDNSYDFDTVQELRNLVTIGVKSLNYKKFIEWFRENHVEVFSFVLDEKLPALPIPATVEDSFEYNPDKGDTRDKTYIKSDLVDLVGMALFMRAMMPYYNDYLVSSMLTNVHPYAKVFELFADSGIEEMGGPLTKLRTYLSANYESIYEKADKQDRIITAGLSEDDVIDVLVSRSIFDKLLMMDFFYGSSNPIQHVYQTVGFGGNFKPTNSYNNIKLVSGESDNGDDDYAIFENFRKTTDLAPGDLEIIRHVLKEKNIIVRTWGINPEDFDWDFYNNELKNIVLYMDTPVEPVKTYMLGWLMKDYINPRALTAIDNRMIVELALLAKTYLYMKGMNYLGSFFGSIYDEESNFVNMKVVSRNTLPKNVSERLGKLYKYYIIDKTPTVEKTIVEFSKQLSNRPWKVFGHNDPNVVNSEGYLLTPPNINDVLVDYVEHIINLSKTTK